ncbi:hypothetical protein M1M34_gp015 [Haloarcula tailed virus 2]|uniref:Uncharacterized protein n=1 Tax=Haloarcula tailed virus 2 TaxID=2877989 RepID=A0AAE8Y0J7_9CAUD|nr:hypothetical protein M1M34_gp015 [Haloarcula tailed virus 2]UBF23166.1 hypothetical protein HATV-2_gp15 [Haloarcula tailed virus 2]
MVESFSITSDPELKTRVRSATDYNDDEDEGILDSDLDNIIKDAKSKVFLETGSKAWYTDDGLGFALIAYTCMRTKAQVENFAISSYTLGNETVNTRNATPEQSQQIQQWADDVRTGMNASELDGSTKPKMQNTSGYIGEDYVYDSYDGY